MTLPRSGPSHGGPDRGRPRWRDRDWWFGRTPAQLERKRRAWEEFRTARAEVRRAWRREDTSPPRRAPETAGVARGAPRAQPSGVLARIEQVGRTLTIVLTIPIVAALLLGPVGLLLGVVLALLLLAGRRSG